MQESNVFKIKECKFYNSGGCRKTTGECSFVHEDDEWHCAYSLFETHCKNYPDCDKRHTYLPTEYINKECICLFCHNHRIGRGSACYCPKCKKQPAKQVASNKEQSVQPTEQVENTIADKAHTYVMSKLQGSTETQSFGLDADFVAALDAQIQKLIDDAKEREKKKIIDQQQKFLETFEANYKDVFNPVKNIEMTTQSVALLILPTQLFEKKYISKQISKYNVHVILIYEHPHYFESYLYNKKKILLHKASLNYYFDYLREQFPDRRIYWLNGNLSASHFQSSNYAKIYVFDPIDKIQLHQFDNIIKLDSPYMLMTAEQCRQYKTKYKQLRNHIFYRFVRDNCELLRPFRDLQSFDKQNRKRIPQNTTIQHTQIQSTLDVHYIDKNRQFVDTHYKQNIGNTQNFRFAVTHRGAKQCLQQFLKNKLLHFGDYQDFISKKDQILFHSCISMYLNIGLLTPEYVLKQLIRFIQQHQITINNIEAFVRQIAGWREFQRLCYLYADFNCNYFENNKQLCQQYYTGKTGISIVDDAILQSIDSGYNHHIVRLMILANFFNLKYIKPHMTFQWFMEVFVDSFEWVMCQNVYGMGLYSDRGQTSTKPYLCSSAYLLKMSDYTNSDNWAIKWDQLLLQFIQKNKNKIKSIYGMNWTENYIKKHQ